MLTEMMMLSQTAIFLLSNEAVARSILTLDVQEAQP
jgi:hypothetical protein